MNYAVEIAYLPEKEFLVLKGYVKLYDSDSAGENEDFLRKSLSDGSVERLKMAARSETVFILFCNTCVRDENEKCYVCGCDIACENLSGSQGCNEFEIVKLNSCEYIVYDCEFINETTLQNAHEKPDNLFWNGWLTENPYLCAIDNQNCKGNGFAAIELYTPLDPDAIDFHAKFFYPILRKSTT